MDIFPTFAKLAGGAAPDGIDGKDVWPMIQDKAPTPHDLIFWRHDEQRAVRRGDWKLLQNLPTEPFRLYNLAEDPLEEHDRSRDTPQVFNQMAEALRAHVQRGGAIPWQKPEE